MFTVSPISAFLTDDAEGGPSKTELLELLQNCDISPVSRLSSALSSRAPSPSPSLMSIMYPAIRPPGGRGSIPASPLSTPLLSAERWRSTHSAAAQHHPAHLFQPIGMSQFSSSASLDETVAARESGVSLVAEDGGVSHPTGQKSALVEEELRADVVHSTRKPLQHNTESMLGMLGREEHKQKSTSAHIEEENIKVHQEVSVHQRSRSNEIDYFSLRSPDTAGQKFSASAFKSPPSLMQPVRPLPSTGSSGLCKDGSVDSTVSPLHSPKSLQQPNNTTCSSDATATAAASTDERECQSEPRDSSLASDDVIKREKTGTSQSERYSWLKDFDSPLWSNYFTSQEDSRYSDC